MNAPYYIALLKKLKDILYKSLKNIKYDFKLNFQLVFGYFGLCQPLETFLPLASVFATFVFQLTLCYLTYSCYFAKAPFATFTWYLTIFCSCFSHCVFLLICCPLHLLACVFHFFAFVLLVFLIFKFQKLRFRFFIKVIQH